MEKVILMVDSSLEKSRKLKVNLENNDYRVLITKDINDALILINTNDIDLIIIFDLDIEYEKIRESKNAIDIPLLGIFDEEYIEKLNKCKEDFNDYIIIPYSKEQLYLKIKNQIKISKLQKLVKQKESELKKAYEELNNFGLIDKVTGLYNSFYFEHILRNQIATSKRYGYQLSGIMISIDNEFDETIRSSDVYKNIAKIINDNIRNNDIFVRLNSEQFYLLLPHTGLKDAVFVANKLKRLVEEYKFKNTNKITISQGVTSLGGFESGLSKEIEMIKKAEDALKNAQNEGGNRIECY